MSTLHQVRHVSVSIARPPADVYAFASNPANLPAWAQGLGTAVEQVGDAWVAESPLGRVKIRFVAPNALGVLDHDVTLETGETFHNPMRVVPNGDGCEVVFTLFRLPAASDAQFAADGSAVERDLHALKALLER